MVALDRLLIVLLLEHWQQLESPPFVPECRVQTTPQEEYYRHWQRCERMATGRAGRTSSLECVSEAADDAATTAEKCFAMLAKHRKAILKTKGAAIPAIQLLDLLPRNPLVTLPTAMQLLKTTKPTATKAIDALCRAENPARDYG